MKMKSLFVVAAVAMSLSSCMETTGNPREGGFFGWSESKAKGRLDDRQREVNRLNADTDRVENRNRYLRNQLN